MPDGKITYPLIGEITAQGQTASELKKTITDKLQNFVTAPEVTVIVRESRSQMIYTIGKLVRPGQLPLTPNMTVMQALSAAGGFAEWADTKNIMIIRRGGGKEIQLRFNYKEFTSGEKIGAEHRSQTWRHARGAMIEPQRHEKAQISRCPIKVK